MDYWDRELTKLFISVFKECPCLYNRRHEDYKNQTKRNEKTEFILNELKVFCPELTLRDVKKKIRHLKGQFSKEKSKILAGERNGRVWWCYKDLQFLNQSNDTSSPASSRVSQSPDHTEMIKQNDSQKPGGQQRVRNILTLQERVRAIEAYDRRPMYTKVASMFNCSWEQIKSIISNRKAIMDFYEATKTSGPIMSPDQEIIRQRKIAFLGECMYEYIQRAQFHARATINEEIIRMKANEFRELIQIENFLPNKAWLNQFKNTYNISLSQGQIVLTRTPPASLDLKHIMTYCSRNKPSDVQQQQPVIRNMYKMTTTMAVDSANKATVEELKQRHLRKINFLGKALYEYVQRSQYHHKTPIDDDLLRKVACELKDMLKIDNFYPNKSWLNHFKTQYNFSASQSTIVFTRTPPFSLDLKDILSYCSRMDHKNAKVSSTSVIVQRETAEANQGAAALEKERQQPQLRSQVMVVQSVVRPEIITPTDVKDELEEDIKPNIFEIKIEPQDPLFIDDDSQKPPPLKIQKIEPMQETQNTLKQPIHSPGHWSEHSSEDEELPKHVTNYNEALKLLKPLEEFAMLEENYRAIGLISQLENIFKNPPPKSD